MTEQMYLDELMNIRKEIRQNKVISALKRLDQLFDWKPVRLRWYIVRAEALIALKRYDEAIELLSNRYDFTYDEPDSGLYLEPYRKWMESKGDRLGARMCLCLKELLAWKENQEIADTQPNRLQAETEIAKLEQLWLDSAGGLSLSKELMDLYYTAGYFVEFHILKLYIGRKWPESSEGHKDPYFIFEGFTHNLWYLGEKLLDQKAHTFAVVIDSENDIVRAYILSRIIQELGHQVKLFTEALPCAVDHEVDIGETVAISLENAEDMDGIHIIHPVRLQYEEQEENNLPHIISHLSSKMTDDILMILAPSHSLDDIVEHPALVKHSVRLGSIVTFLEYGYYSFGYAGDYLLHLNDLYKMDVRKEVEKKPTCRFSIILPVRNSVNTLKHTLQTCLNQRYDDYEIVVSDNSTEGHYEIEDLIKEINNPKIKYYKTPRSLGLNKSFEFAFLKAKGEFLFSLGSDDAIFPWGLEMLSETLNNFPDENIICWERALYIWPNFHLKCQLGQFIIPRSYRKNQVSVKQRSSKECLKQLLEMPSIIYGEPLFYINSGFRREYLKTLLKETGKLWVGHAQDVYMGIANLCINKEIMHIAYPITMAGLSGGSTGSSATKLSEKNKGLYHIDLDNCMKYIENRRERMMGLTGTEACFTLIELLRLSVSGILPLEIEEELTAENVHIMPLLTETKTHDYCDHNVQFSRYISRIFDKERQEELRQSYYDKLMEPQYIQETSNSNLIYQQGFDEFGGLTLDSRKFDIQNIEEAVMLFENITNL